MMSCTSLIDQEVMKTRNDCETACDCVKHANVVFHVGLCKGIFAKKHTATHKPTSARPLIVTTMTQMHSVDVCMYVCIAHIHTYIYTAFTFFSKLCLILKNRFLARLSSNFQLRLFMPSY